MGRLHLSWTHLVHLCQTAWTPCLNSLHLTARSFWYFFGWFCLRSSSHGSRFNCKSRSCQLAASVTFGFPSGFGIHPLSTLSCTRDGLPRNLINWGWLHLSLGCMFRKSEEVWFPSCFCCLNIYKLRTASWSAERCSWQPSLAWRLLRISRSELTWSWSLICRRTDLHHLLEIGQL